jgi:hypothetical protein
VSVLQEGKQTSQFRSEMPLPQGAMLSCDGSCVVRSEALQLTVHDKGLFSMSEGASAWDVTVNSGRIDFALRPNAKPLTFITPHDTIRTDNGSAVPGKDGVVRGTLTVTKDGTQIALEDGSLRVANSDGEKTLAAGQSLSTAAADGGPALGAGTAVSAVGGGGAAALAAGTSGGSGAGAALAAGGAVSSTAAVPATGGGTGKSEGKTRSGVKTKPSPTGDEVSPY